MAKKCFYCSNDIDGNEVVDMCKVCMHNIWGEKMTVTIINNMQREKKSGNLELGRVSEFENEEEFNVFEEKAGNLEEELHPLEQRPSTNSDESNDITFNNQNNQNHENDQEIEYKIKQINDVKDEDLDEVQKINELSNPEERDPDVFRSESNFGI